MTVAFDQSLDCAKFEFDIPCRWEDHPCDRDAAVMCKGCADDDGRALCIDHYFKLQRWFSEQMPATCETCYRPFMHFDTHYDTIKL